MATAAHAITDDLDMGDLEARIHALREGRDPDAEQLAAEVEQHFTDEHRYYAPLADAADEYVTWSREPGVRVYTGIAEFDEAMRGIAPSELMLVVGFAHSGKTVFTTQVILNNSHRNVAMFSPDETRVLVLIKLFSIFHGIGAEEIEYRLQRDDDDMEQMLRTFATEHFPNLAVFDEISDLTLFDKALDEYEEVHGRTELVVIDYAQLVTGAGEDVAGTINAIKAWGKRRRVAIILLHQSSRSKGAGGGKVTIDSGGYGGEQQALFLVGVRRKKNQYLQAILELEDKIASATQQRTIDHLTELLTDARYELARHENTITFSLVKNKRPPGRLVDDIDFILDPDTGRVKPMELGGAHSRANTWEQQEVSVEPF